MDIRIVIELLSGRKSLFSQFLPISHGTELDVSVREHIKIPNLEDYETITIRMTLLKEHFHEQLKTTSNVK